MSDDTVNPTCPSETPLETVGSWMVSTCHTPWTPTASPTPNDECAYFVQLTPDPLDLVALHAMVTDPRCGGIASFVGVTRQHFEGRIVRRLEYSCYSAMALKQLQMLCTLLFSKFDGVHRVVVSHRLGHVPVTEASVAIVVASEHRASGLAAVAWAIDELKATVPIWKQEVYVEEHSAPTEGAPAAWKSNGEFTQRFRGATVGSATESVAPPI